MPQFNLGIGIQAPKRRLIDVWLAPDAGIVRWLRRFSPTRFVVADLERR